MIESDDTEETMKVRLRSSGGDDGRGDPAIAVTSLLSSTHPLNTSLDWNPMTSTATTPDSPDNTERCKIEGKRLPNTCGWNRRLGGPRTAKCSQNFLANKQGPGKEVEEKEKHRGKDKRKEGDGEDKEHNTPSELQEGQVIHEKQRNLKKNQSTALGPSEQKKSLGLVGSAKNHEFLKHESKNTRNSRLKRGQTRKKWKRESRGLNSRLRLNRKVLKKYKAKNKMNKAPNKNKKEATNTPGKMQEGRLMWYKSRIQPKRQSSDLAGSRQKKSLGLERSAEKGRKSEADKRFKGSSRQEKGKGKTRPKRATGD